jgi:GNAT superfamily N-acetyltransferase
MRLISLAAPERATLADAVERAWCAAWGALGRDGASQVDDTPQFLRILTPGSSDLLLNAVLRFRHAHPVQCADIEAVIAPFRAAHRPLQWWLRTDAAPAGLCEQLYAHGMRIWGTPPGMALRLAGWQPPVAPSPSVVVRPVATREDATAALQIICTVFNLAAAPMRRWCAASLHNVTYLATIGTTPVGAMVRLSHDDVAGFFHVATLPRFRRRGVAWAMMCHALGAAQAEGAALAALTAAPMAISLYQRLGFVTCCTIDQWMPGPELMQTLCGV